MKLKSFFLLRQAGKVQSRYYSNYTKNLLNRTNLILSHNFSRTVSLQQSAASPWVLKFLKFSTSRYGKFSQKNSTDLTLNQSNKTGSVPDTGKNDINQVDSEWLKSYNSKFLEGTSNSSNEFHNLLKDIRLTNNGNRNLNKSNSLEGGLNEISNKRTSEAILAAKNKGVFFYPASNQVPYVTLLIIGAIIATQIYFYIQIYKFRTCQTVQEILDKADDIIFKLNFFSLQLKPSTLPEASSHSSSINQDISDRHIENHYNKNFYSQISNFLNFFFIKSLIASIHLNDSTLVSFIKGLSFFLAGSFLERLWGPIYFSSFILASTGLSNLSAYYIENTFFPNIKSLEIPLQGTTGFITACVLATAGRYPNAAIYKGIPISNRFLISPLAVFLLNDFIDILQYIMNDARKRFEQKNYADTQKDDTSYKNLYSRLTKARLVHLGCILSEEEKKMGLYKSKETSRLNKSTMEQLSHLEKQWSEIGSPNLKGISDIFSLFTICFIIVGSRFFKRVK